MKIKFFIITKSQLTNIGLLRYCLVGKSKFNKHGYKGIHYFLGLIIAVFLSISVSAKPNELAGKYSMHLMGINIGEFSVRQTVENGQVNIEAITDVDVKLLISYRIKYVQHTVYSKGILQSSRVETYKNGDLNSSSLLKHQNKSYLLIADGDTTTINDSIEYSGSLIYFNEPTGIKKIYKERSAEMQQINSVNKHTYVIKDENEKELNRYFYEDGILQYAQMKHVIETIELKRITTNEIND